MCYFLATECVLLGKTSALCQSKFWMQASSQRHMLADDMMLADGTGIWCWQMMLADDAGI